MKYSTATIALALLFGARGTLALFKQSLDAQMLAQSLPSAVRAEGRAIHAATNSGSIRRRAEGDTCTFCANGGTPTKIDTETFTLLGQTTSCKKEFELEEEQTSSESWECPLGQWLYHEKCGCPEAPELPSTAAEKTCSICPDGLVDANKVALLDGIETTCGFLFATLESAPEGDDCTAAKVVAGEFEIPQQCGCSTVVEKTCPNLCPFGPEDPDKLALMEDGSEITCELLLTSLEYTPQGTKCDEVLTVVENGGLAQLGCECASSGTSDPGADDATATNGGTTMPPAAGAGSTPPASATDGGTTTGRPPATTETTPSSAAIAPVGAAAAGLGGALAALALLL